MNEGSTTYTNTPQQNGYRMALKQDNLPTILNGENITLTVTITKRKESHSKNIQLVQL